MNVEKMIGFVLICVAMIVLLRQHRPEFGVMLSVGAAGVLLLWVTGNIFPIIEEIIELSNQTGINSESSQILIKSLGICFLTQTAIDTCKDAGESALANKAELAGKVAVLFLGLPLLKKLIETALMLISY